MRDLLRQFLERPQVVSRRVRGRRGWQRQLLWHFPAATHRASGVTVVDNRFALRLLAAADGGVLELSGLAADPERVHFASIAAAEAAYRAVWRALRGPRWGRWLLVGVLALLVLGSLDDRSLAAGSSPQTWTPPPLQKAS